MESRQWRGLTRTLLSVAIGVLSFIALLTTMQLLIGLSSTEAATGGPSGRMSGDFDTPSAGHAIPHLNGISPTLQLLAFQPSEGEYLFTVRLSKALSHTQYIITSYHHTDSDYPQKAVTVTTDSAGVASARVWSRCTYQSVLTGYVFAQLQQAGVLQAKSNQLNCPALRTVGDFGSNLTIQPANDDWIYRPSPPGPGSVHVWVRDAAGQAGLTGTISIRSAEGYLLPEQPVTDEGGGLYSYVWSIAGLPRADDYRVQLTLSDATGGISGLDAFVKLSGRAMWVWGKAVDSGNPGFFDRCSCQGRDPCRGAGWYPRVGGK